jgi:leucyl/phenylalanyl-tRNA---protein transferase
MHVLSDKIFFPPLEAADEEGLLAIGGDLSEKRLLLAYESGIFPWYDGDVILWWSPNPRFVLLPAELRISKSMKQVLKGTTFQFTVNKAFDRVIHQCKIKERTGQDGTWITDEMEKAYIQLHQKGKAISAEVWHNEDLVGGLYGVKQGNVFCGESMFALKSNASKYAFIKLVQQMEKDGIELIDCQVYTEHLESLGAKMISRESYMQYLKKRTV